DRLRLGNAVENDRLPVIRWHLLAPLETEALCCECEPGAVRAENRWTRRGEPFLEDIAVEHDAVSVSGIDTERQPAAVVAECRSNRASDALVGSQFRAIDPDEEPGVPTAV